MEVSRPCSHMKVRNSEPGWGPCVLVDGHKCPHNWKHQDNMTTKQAFDAFMFQRITYEQMREHFNNVLLNNKPLAELLKMLNTGMSYGAIEDFAKQHSIDHESVDDAWRLFRAAQIRDQRSFADREYHGKDNVWKA